MLQTSHDLVRALQTACCRNGTSNLESALTDFKHRRGAKRLTQMIQRIPGSPLNLVISLPRGLYVRHRMLRALLRAGADPNRTGSDGRNALHFALDESPELVPLLVKFGVSVHTMHQGVPAVHKAVHSHVPNHVLLCLLEAGANVDQPNYKGKMPIHMALRCGQPEKVLILLQWGAAAPEEGAPAFSPPRHPSSMYLFERQRHAIQILNDMQLCSELENRILQQLGRVNS